MQTVEILDESDLGEVLTLQRAAFALEVIDQYPYYPDPLRQTLDELRSEQSAKDARALGIRDDGRLIGAIRTLPVEGDAFYLARLSVAPDRTKEGLGRKLMQEAVSYVKTTHPSARSIQFRADGTNTWLIDWYRSLGFKVVELGTAESPDDWLLGLPLEPGNYSN